MLGTAQNNNSDSLHPVATEENPAVDKVGEALVAQRFRMLEDIARELSEKLIFPTCFDVTLRLRKELQEPDISISRIARIVSVEPLVAARLTRMANSAYYNVKGEPVLDLPGAIARLGLRRVRSTTLAIAMTQFMHAREMALFSDIASALWTHVVRTASAASVLARNRTSINPDEAMLAGLVHDMGAFYTLYRAAQYPELRMRPITVRHLIMQWHEGIGNALLHALQLPLEIVEAVADHDRPRPLPETLQTLGDIVYVANILGSVPEQWPVELDPDTVQSVRTIYADLLPEIEAEAREMEAVFA